MISEKTLRRWRKDALQSNRLFEAQRILNGTVKETDQSTLIHQELSERILRLTQELMDLHLMRKG